MYEFIRHPAQYALLQQDPALVAGAVEEVLRFRNPVIFLRRTATQDQDPAGQADDRRGRGVCVLGSPTVIRGSSSARRNSTSAGRRARPHHYRPSVARAHFCLGIQQARLNLTVTITELARRIHEPRLARPPRQARSIFIDGLKQLAVAFTPQAEGASTRARHLRRRPRGQTGRPGGHLTAGGAAWEQPERAEQEHHHREEQPWTFHRSRCASCRPSSGES